MGAVPYDSMVSMMAFSCSQGANCLILLTFKYRLRTDQFEDRQRFVVRNHAYGDVVQK